MICVVEKYQNLAVDLRLDAEYYVVSKDIGKAFERLFSKTYKGFKTGSLKKYFTVRINDIPESANILAINSTSTGKIEYRIIEKPGSNKRYSTTITSKTDEISVLDLVHFFEHEEVQDYLGLRLKGSVLPIIDKASLDTLKIPIPKIPLATINSIEYKGIIPSKNNEFKAFISTYFNQYHKSLKSENLIAATMLAGAISEAILYQFLIDSGVSEKLLDQRGLGGLIRDIKLGKFNEQEGRNFPLTAFEELNKLRNDIVHPSRAIFKLKTDYELIDRSELERQFRLIKRFFGF